MMNIRGASWGKKAEIYVKQKTEVVSQFRITTKVEKSRVGEHEKFIVSSEDQSQHSQVDTSFQCLGCKSSKAIQPSHIIHWDIGAETPLVCSGNSNHYYDEGQA